MQANDKKILDYIQTEIPLIKRPFIEVAMDLDLREEYVLRRIKYLKRKNIIREISAIFETGALGYKSTLVAIRVPGSKIKHIVRLINKHPGVSHNYLRHCVSRFTLHASRIFNIWFTLTIPKKESFQKHIKSICDMRYAKCEYVILPAERVYKIDARFGVKKDNEQKIKRKIGKIKTDNRIRKIIIGLQKDLPITKEPYDKIAKQSGISTEVFLITAKELKKANVIRRYGAVVRHKKIGFKANAMIAWRIEEENEKRIGTEFAKLDFVSHCYKRKAFKLWPYNLYTMVHAKNNKEMQFHIRKMENISRTQEFIPFYTLREFKKERVKYFV